MLQDFKVLLVRVKQKRLVISEFCHLFGELEALVATLSFSTEVVLDPVCWNDLEENPAKLLNRLENHIDAFRILGEQDKVVNFPEFSISVMDHLICDLLDE